jgi:hypothetical protein
MTLLDFEELTAYWVEHPPVHILVAAYLGLGPKNMSDYRASGSRNCDLDQILAGLGPGFSSQDVHAELGPVELDFEELRSKAP